MPSLLKRCKHTGAEPNGRAAADLVSFLADVVLIVIVYSFTDHIYYKCIHRSR